MMAGWTPTGWLIKNGQTIQLSLSLPAGVHAEIRRGNNGRWSYNYRASGRYNPTGSFQTKNAAMRACERALKAELKSALRMLEKIGAAGRHRALTRRADRAPGP
jgi:hypothetical protein